LRNSGFQVCKCQSLQPTLFRIRDVLMHFEGWDFTVRAVSQREARRRTKGEGESSFPLSAEIVQRRAVETSPGTAVGGVHSPELRTANYVQRNLVKSCTHAGRLLLESRE
jgi:hypothetical protein